MALECQEANGFCSKDSIDNSPVKEIAPFQPISGISTAISIPNYVKRPFKKSTLPKPFLSLPSRKNSPTLNPVGNGDSGSNGRRLIIDLPPVLVSEILHCLDAKDLGRVSCVSTFLHSLASNHLGWKNFYFERWGPPVAPVTNSEKSWKELFVERELKSKSFMGRYSMDALHGHTEAVRAVFLLWSANLIFTGGYDSVIRMWDLEEGFAISVSRSLGCTIRAIAADTELLVAAGTGAFIQCWRAIDGNQHLFDITGSITNPNSEFRLWGHEGPVTCLAMDPGNIFSGSWDMSVRVWDRASMRCLKTLRHADWVWTLVPRGSTVASTAGRDAYIWDIRSGGLVSVVHNAHVGNSNALARSYAGDLLFTGGEDGTIHMFEIVSSRDDVDIRPRATWKPHTGPVNALAFEFPWLVSASSEGRLALIDVRKLLKPNQHSRDCQSTLDAIEPPQRMLHGFGSNLFSVAIGADRIVCGGEEGVVRVWNFSQALEIERRVSALRGIRLENRMRRRKAQIEMNGKSGQPDQTIVSPKRNQMSGSRNGVWHGKQRDRKS